MLTEAQRAERRTRLGATDASALLGLNPHRGETSVYVEKTTGADPFSPSWEAWFGSRMEPVLLDALREVTPPGTRVDAWQECQRHPEISCIGCTPDGLMHADGDILVEEKTAWSYNEEWDGRPCPAPPPDPDPEYYNAVWTLAERNGDRIPKQYLVQCQWSLGVTGLDKALVVALPATGRGAPLTLYLLRRDAAFIDMLYHGATYCRTCEREVRADNATCGGCGSWSWMGGAPWWKEYIEPVQRGARPPNARVPDPDGSRSAGWALAQLAPIGGYDRVMPADAEIEEWAEQYAVARLEANEATARQQHAKQELQRRCIEDECDGYEGTFGSFKSKRRSDGALGWYPQGIKEI